MTWLDWLGASFCFAAVVALLTWAAAALADAWPRNPAATARPDRDLAAPRSLRQMYLDGGGDLSNPRVAALLAEAERGWNRRNNDEAPTGRRSSTGADPQDATPLHAHEITPNDAAMIRMMAGAHFGPDATVTLPSGRTITGTEMQQWIEAND